VTHQSTASHSGRNGWAFGCDGGDCSDNGKVNCNGEGKGEGNRDGGATARATARTKVRAPTLFAYLQ